MNNARRILSKGFTLLRGCWFWSKKLLFRKNFDENFNAAERFKRGRVYCPPENLQHWEVAKTTK